ncbi:hypothetical protein rpr22_0880 [Rickettsia prowazekii str. Rp22]|uniref:Uncharacterized protein n=1 Tax=Rickettsia prowazekii (strain Rp22) TaxID=449216 RepID=D5AYA0_RICPP|nr:hypothetical protein rpr22_0880 [Rickettsia prowazekii str. Rp22]
MITNLWSLLTITLNIILLEKGFKLPTISTNFMLIAYIPYQKKVFKMNSIEENTTSRYYCYLICH